MVTKSVLHSPWLQTQTSIKPLDAYYDSMASTGVCNRMHHQIMIYNTYKKSKHFSILLKYALYSIQLPSRHNDETMRC